MPHRYLIYWGDRPMKDLRTLTPMGFTMVRRHGVRLARAARSLVLTAMVLSALSYESYTLSAGLTALGFVAAVACLLTAFLFHSHAQRLFKVQADDLLAFIDGEEVDGRGTIIFNKGKLTWWTNIKNVKQVAALPPSSTEALSQIAGIRGGVATREMSPDEAAEYRAHGPVINEAAGFVVALFALVSIGFGGDVAAIYVGIAGFVLMLAFVHRYIGPRILRARIPTLLVRVDAKVRNREVKWAEFLPDGRPWTIEGEPAMWRRP